MSLETLLTIGVAAVIFLTLVALRLVIGGLVRLTLKLAGRAPARRPARRAPSHSLQRSVSPASAWGAVQRKSARVVKATGAAVAAAGLAIARAGCSVAEAGAAYEAKLRRRADEPAAVPPPPPPQAPPQIDLRDEDPLGVESGVRSPLGSRH